ncbi:MAG TPA: hypothetical protein ENG52_01280 [Nitrososphaeria archaeon]|nr:hypothetical protein [Nitrososphaeria archaeon]
MPEIWFRYGVTEVSLGIPDELNYRVLGLEKPKLDEGFWRRLAEFAEGLRSGSGSSPIAILYDHAGDEVMLTVLRHLIEALDEEGVGEVRLLASCWRLDRAAGVEHLQKSLKARGISLKPILPGESGLADFKGLRIAPDLLEASSIVIVSDTRPHGVLGTTSIREALGFGGFVEAAGLEDPREFAEEVWRQLAQETAIYGVASLGERMLLGEGEEVLREIREADLSRPVEDFDVVLAGCGGSPIDSTFQSMAHVISLLRDSVVDEGLIGVIGECGGGLGSRSFIEALLSGGGGVLEKLTVRALREVLADRRVALTSALPKSILGRLFGVRGFDTPQELLTYALRIYSRSARILILEEPLVKPVRAGSSGRSSGRS